MKKTTAILAASLLLSACNFTSRASDQFQSPEQSYVLHTVSHPGETLGLISNWYTGTPSNWHLILKHNPGLDLKRIKIGQTVRIPQGIVKTSSPLPAKFIKPRLLLVSNDDNGDYVYPE